MKKVLVYILMLISVVFISGCGDSFTKKEQDDFKEEIELAFIQNAVSAAYYTIAAVALIILRGKINRAVGR